MCRRTGRCPIDLLVRVGCYTAASITVNVVKALSSGMENFVFRAFIENRVVAHNSGRHLVPHVILCFGKTQVKAWKIPESQREFAYIDADAYCEQIVAEKLVEALDWRETADRLYADNVE